MSATESQIKQWKAKYGEVHEVCVEIEADQEAFAYFKKPDRRVLALAAKFIENDPIKAGDVLFENCWVGGDEQIKDDDEARLACIELIGKLFKKKQASIKKL
jgi:hypothetical protein